MNLCYLATSALVSLSLTCGLAAPGPGKNSDFTGRRVLFIGIDGCRADALAAAMERGLAPQMKALSESPTGLLSRSFYAGGEKDSATHQPTVSGPGWSSLLTGVWMNKHKVKDNRFLGARFQTWPHFMRRIKEVKPSAWCASFADWPPIHDFIADGSRSDGQEFLNVKFTCVPDASRHFIDNPEKDIEVRDAALSTLRTQNPDAMFVYFGQVDEFGHGAVDSRASFSPDSTLYLNAISHVDSHIGELLRGLRARPHFADEDWLVLITTDHGGRGNSHGGDSDAERNIWLIADGRKLERERLQSKPVGQTELVPMIYQHMGITPRPEWDPPPPVEPPPPSIPSVEPKAACSIHLGWPSAPATWFYNEATVRKSTRGSYFMVCGWNTGYFGVQELGDGGKAAIFSVWDPAKGDNPDNVPLEQRVEVVHSAPGVEIARFGGEGTGGRCMMPFPWKLDEKVRCLVQAVVEGEKTSYAGWLWIPATRSWLHMVTFRVKTGGAPLSGLYSFVEDFRRDGDSVKEERRCEFGNGWVRTLPGAVEPLATGVFTASTAASEARDLIDAGQAGSTLFLANGGNVRTTTAVGTRLRLVRDGDSAPDDLPAAVRK